MNQFKLILICFFLTCFINTAASQALKKGDMALDVYCGWPNWDKLAIRGFGATLNFLSESDYNPDYSGSGPFGARIEYMVQDEFGLGLDFGYISASSEDRYYDFATQQTYTYTQKISKIGVVVSFNYHFKEMPDNMDLALNLGIGPALRNASATSTEPDYPSAYERIPTYAFRLGTTYRLFLGDHFGLNIGLGLAHGGLINFGLSFKW
jgi:hypothetical protein